MANRYWVGGTGNWTDATNHWAAISGGAPAPTNLPGTGDTAIFDAASNTTAYTVTIDAAANCLDLNFSAAPSVSGTITWAGTAAMNIYGSMTLLSGMTRSYTGTLNFLATATGKTITMNSVALGGPVTFNGSGGGWQLQDNFNIGTSSTCVLTLTLGSLDFNNKTVTFWGFASSGTGTRSLTCGSSSITATGGSGGTRWNTATTTNFTFTAGTSTLTFQGIVSMTFSGGGLTFYNVVFTAVDANLVAVVGNNTFNNLTFTGTATGSAPTNQGITINGNQTVNGTFTATGSNANTRRRLIRSSQDNTRRTITAAVVSITNMDFKDIAGAGAGTWSGTSIGNGGNCTGITFTTPVTRYWVGNGGNYSDTAHWSTSSGGGTGASMPLPQDSTIFDANSISSASQTITLGYTTLPTMNFSAVNNSPTLAFTSIVQYIIGNLTLKSGLTITGTNTININEQSATITWDCASVSFTQAITIDAPSTTLQLGSNFVSASSINWQSATITTNNYNITCTIFSSSSSQVRTLNLGSSTVTVTGTGTVWNMAGSNLTLNAGTSTIKLTDASATSKTFAGLSKTYNNVWLTGAGTGTFDFSGSNTFNDFKCDTPPHTIRFTAGTTTTVTTFTVSGTAGNLITIGSLSASAHILTKSGGGTISCDYLSISYSTANPDLTWYAGVNSTNGGNNTRWYFSAPGTNWTKALTDTMTLAESKASLSDLYPTDTLFFTELLGKLPTVNKTDTVTLSDSLAKSFVDVLTDILTLSDLRAMTVADFLSDTQLISDLISKASGNMRTDTMSISDTRTETSIKAQYNTDSITLSDSKLFDVHKDTTDIVALAESIIKGSVIPKTELLSIADSKTLLTDKNLSSSLALSDAIRLAMAIALSSSEVIIDDKVVSVARAITDALGITETYISNLGSEKGLTDTQTISDAIGTLVQRGIILTDTLDIADVNTKVIGLVILDTQDLYDTNTAAGAITRLLEDTFTLTDSYATASGIVLSLTDYNALADALQKQVKTAVTDNINISDSKVISMFAVFNDTQLLGDSVTSVAAHFSTISDSMTLNDALTSNLVELLLFIFKKSRSPYSAKGDILKAKLY